ncbi:MAG: transporter substrate-binding domain-containing protein [Spirochaetaceae bacterium]|jgi:polar amino acid transport system substrate-binding protein|nr:transporter substrate-binding domain-containing protein [Spirochaetaceae bacterium]
MNTNKIVPIFLLFFSFFLSSETLTISTIEGSPISDIASLILEEIYDRAGLELKIVSMPALRATREAIWGNTDGETHRVFSYGELHPELVIISESYYTIETVLFTQKDNPALHAERGSLYRYSFSILKGVEKSIELTKGYDQVSEFVTSDKIMEFLSLGRTDFALLSKLNGISVINRLKLEGISIYTPPLEITSLYHYLNKEHSHLVPLLEQTIRELKESGKLDEIIKRAEEQVMGRLIPVD